MEISYFSLLKVYKIIFALWINFANCEFCKINCIWKLVFLASLISQTDFSMYFSPLCMDLKKNYNIVTMESHCHICSCIPLRASARIINRLKLIWENNIHPFWIGNDRNVASTFYMLVTKITLISGDFFKVWTSFYWSM